MPTMRANKLNKGSKNTGNRDTTGPLAQGNSRGKEIGRPSINRAGGSQNFRTPLSDALRQKLTEISRPEQKTYASTIADDIVGTAPTEVKESGITNGANALPMFVNTAADRTEGKPAQPSQITGNIPTDPAQRVELVKQIFARALERAE